MTPAGPARDIVLVGGGHAHVHVLRAFGKRPEPGVRITLITRELATPYSGMLPGVIAGLYTASQAHIDLVRLAATTGTRLIHAEAIGLDRVNKRIELGGSPPVAYDLASIDVGITPALAAIDGAAGHAIAVKPIGSFLAKFDALLEQCAPPDGSRRIVVIGGGAGGVELMLSVRARLLGQAKAHADEFSFTLITANEILAQHNARVRDAFRRILGDRKIGLHEGKAVLSVFEKGVSLANGTTIPADAMLITTDAAPPPWFERTGLARDDAGFLAVGPTLQVLNDPDVFAAGDCAALTASPRPKSGVFAVRAGPPLAENLVLRARGEPPRPWTPQRQHLALISTGERYAVASRGWFKAEGASLWTLKDWIDRRWMRQYQEPSQPRSRLK